jgi:MFS transporter, AAHS family, 4-hydroxybenzoate transporter
MTFRSMTISEVIDRRPFGNYQKKVVAICALLAFVEGFGAQNAGPVAPALARSSWHLSHNAIGQFTSLGIFGLMIGALFVAPLADRIGRKPVLLASVIMFGLCSFGMGLATSVTMLFTFRFLTLLGIGGAMPNAVAMTSEYSPHRARSLSIVLMFNGFIVGSIGAGLTAARLSGLYGWRSVFIVGGVLPLMLAPLVASSLPESVRFLAARNGADPRIARLMRPIDPAIEDGVLFVPDGHYGNHVSVAALFRQGRARKTIFLWILVFCSLLDLFLLSTWLPTQIASLGVGVTFAILIGTLLQVGGMIGMLQGWLMDKIGPSRTLAMAYLIGASAIAWLAYIGPNIALLSCAVLFAGFGIVGGQTASYAVVAAAYPTEIRATGVGWFSGVGRVGSVIGPLVAGWLLSSMQQAGTPANLANRRVFLLAVVPALIAAAASLGIRVEALGPVSENTEPTTEVPEGRYETRQF